MPRRQKIKVSSGSSRARYFGLRGGSKYLSFRNVMTGETVHTFGLTRLTSKFNLSKVKTKIKRVKKK